MRWIVNWDWKNENRWVSAADVEGHFRVSLPANKGLEVGSHGPRGTRKSFAQVRERYALESVSNQAILERDSLLMKDLERPG